MNYYTLDEKKKIAEYVKKYSGNLKLAFALAAKELGRSSKGVSHLWYRNLRKEGRVFNLPYVAKNTKNIPVISKEVAEARLKAKLAVRATVNSNKARADVLAINKALRALNS